jgi:hypothetical protein
MPPDYSDHPADRVELSDVVDEQAAELRCLLGPAIRLATGSLPADGVAIVNVDRDEIIDLLRHLALDARASMAGGGTLTIHTGCLGEAPDCAAMVIHEAPASPPTGEETEAASPRKGRTLGLEASYEMIKHAGGHFHVSCRGAETALTICFPLSR